MTGEDVNFPRVSVADEVLVNREGSTAVLPIADLVTQVAASGAISAKYISRATVELLNAISASRPPRQRAASITVPAKASITSWARPATGSWSYVGPLPTRIPRTSRHAPIRPSCSAARSSSTATRCCCRRPGHGLQASRQPRSRPTDRSSGKRRSRPARRPCASTTSTLRWSRPIRSSSSRVMHHRPSIRLGSC